MKRKSVSTVSRIVLVIAMCSMMMCMAACDKDVKVKINDSGVTTEVDAKTNMTVKEILDEAGISLGEKDESEPQVDQKLEEATEITVKRYAKVTVKHGTDEKTVELVGATVKEAVEKAGFPLDDSVVLDVDQDAYLKDGMVITLSSSAAVSLTADGKTDKYKTYAKTVKDFLDEQNITLGKEDQITPQLEDPIEDGLQITVKRVEYKEETEKESIGFETEEKQSDALYAGETQVTQEGAKGEKEITYKVKYVDGKEESREKISEEVTKEPVNQVVTIGTAVQSSETQASQPTVESNVQASQAEQQPTESSAQASQTEPPAAETSTQASQAEQPEGKQVVSKQAVYNCDGSGHGYYVITYSDGSVEYEEF